LKQVKRKNFLDRDQGDCLKFYCYWWDESH